MVVDDQTVYDAIYKATDAPNHGMREPWRLVHISKDKLGDFSRDITRFAFPDSPDKREDHFHAVTNLGGMLLLILKMIQDNVKVVKLFCIWSFCSKFNVTFIRSGYWYLLEVATIYL